MRFLLDTHALIWFYQADPKLSSVARQLIEEPTNEMLVSPATYWEIAIKLATQKPILQVPFRVFIQEAIHDNGFKILPIEPHHCDRLLSLPNYHKDPFDRLLIAQALTEAIPIIGLDPAFEAYGVQRFW